MEPQRSIDFAMLAQLRDRAHAHYLRTFRDHSERDNAYRSADSAALAVVAWADALRRSLPFATVIARRVGERTAIKHIMLASRFSDGRFIRTAGDLLCRRAIRTGALERITDAFRGPHGPDCVACTRIAERIILSTSPRSR